MEDQQQLAACPFCGGKNAAVYSVKSCHSVLCTGCGGEGPEAESEAEAVAAWNEAIKAWNRRASPSSSVLERAREALKRADQFIRNGVEFGFIRMPDAGCPDPAHDTPEVIRSALAEIDRALGGGNAE